MAVVYEHTVEITSNLDDVIELDEVVFGEKKDKAEWLAKAGLTLYVIRSPEGQVVSYAAVYQDGDNKHVWKVGTRDDYKRRGCLKALVAAVRKVASDRDVTIGTEPARPLFAGMVGFLAAEEAAGRAERFDRGARAKAGYVYYRWPAPAGKTA